MPQIESLHWYPVKGAKGWEFPSLQVNTQGGVIGDRQFAIPQKPMDETCRPDPFEKSDFFVCATTSRMAIEDTTFIWGSIDDATYDLEKVQQLAERLGVEGTLQILNSRGTHHYGDTGGAQVSFVNMATHQKFEEFVGKKVDTRRWRMNGQIIGMP